MKLNNAFNCRFLDGSCINFIRSDDISLCDENDLDVLKQHHVTTIIDLRSSFEIKECNYNFSQFSCFHIPFVSEDNNTSDLLPLLQQGGLSLLYQLMVKDNPSIERILDVLANSEGCALYHCTAGKDRTGVLSMMLMMLAGFDLKACQDDYEPSYDNIRNSPNFKPFQNIMMEKMMYSNRDYIEAVYHDINTVGIEVFLKHCGVSDETLNKLKNKLIF